MKFSMTRRSAVLMLAQTAGHSDFAPPYARPTMTRPVSYSQ
jgi:hypothetical protein